MSYVDQGMSRGRVWAIISVAVLHALLAYAFVSGLAYKFIKEATEDLKAFDVKETPPPPPEEPPPPPPEQPTSPPMTAMESPIVRPSPPMQITPPAEPRPIQPLPVPQRPDPPPPPPPPPPVRTQPPQRARANLNSYFSADDYPAAALRGNDQGTTGFSLTIGANGRVTDCSVTSSSGSAALDQATCRILRSRARYTPARDSSGNPTSGRDSGRVTWRLPSD